MEHKNQRKGGRILVQHVVLRLLMDSKNLYLKPLLVMYAKRGFVFLILVCNRLKGDETESLRS